MYMPRPGLTEFDYVKPASLPEASRLLAERADEARPFMGGTDLFVRIRDGFIRPQIVVDVKHLPGMRGIVYDEQAGLTIGAAATMNEVARHPAVQAHYPLLAEAANSVATYQLRNRATLGGNLCNGSPAADTAPAALVLEGRFVLYGSSGEREVPAVEFFLGPGETAMQAGELMTAVRFPPPRAGGVGKYLKLGRNRAGDLSIVGVAVFGFPHPSLVGRGRGRVESRQTEKNTMNSTSSQVAVSTLTPTLSLPGRGGKRLPSGYVFRIALASVAPVPLQALEAEEVLAARPPGEKTFALAAEKAMEAATPIDDVRASAAYRKAMVRALTLRGLRDVAEAVAERAELAGQEE